MRSSNERVQLAMQILAYRNKLRRVVWDDATIKELQAELARLERQLREIDE